MSELTPAPPHGRKRAPAHMCGRRSKQTGQPCQLAAGPNGEPCRFHGGATPQIKAKAARLKTEREISEALGKLNVVPVHDPLTALSELAGEIVAWKELAADRVAVLKGMAQENNITGAEEVKAEIQVFERALDRCISVLATIARLNIDERLVRISEKQAEIVKAALLGALTDTGVNRDVQREAAGHLARRLRAVAS